MKRDEQLGNSTPVPADRRHDEHRMIADAWLASALDGIRQMSHDEAARREVARKISDQPGRPADNDDPGKRRNDHATVTGPSGEPPAGLNLRGTQPVNQSPKNKEQHAGHDARFR